MKQHILLAEDDFDYASILKQYLEFSGFTVTWAKDGKEALKNFSDTKPDICVLDVMMPHMDGFTLAENIIDNYPETPFIFLTAKSLKEDKIKGLRLGADDYVVKPFEVEELILRIQNILKRSQKPVVGIPQEALVFSIGTYIFDRDNYTLTHEEITHRITEKDAQLIQFLYANKNKLVKREDILKEIWGNDDFFSGRSMDVFISRLRKYFSKDPNISIPSIRGLGFQFNSKDE
ncbi:DNA-binding response regulator [Flavobacterium aquidurense]|jgi:DNA-binding response OmpR family regulator|uniref:response regulator transcription factor n=1 Tax=Flavobacterium aquidurense TaxID=362413 RepID=UPI0009240FCB|nr:response regulator transcription factor [Flavobacterium aquidurense]OXA67333.1 DNA-binding response regulator [Flavobacterium aquidurense]SHH64785.1 DNA-binding response regulator, OmpR family, contains REC and winged-helix (wHTH) domain [Flavobacterium frigidimaris]